MKSIGGKLWAAFMSLVLVVLALLWFFQIVFLKQFYVQMKINKVAKEGVAIAQILAAGDKEEFAQRMDEFAYKNNITAEVVDLERHTLYFSGETSLGGQMPMQRTQIKNEALRQILTGETVSVAMTHPRFGSEFRLLGLPVPADGRIWGALFLNLPLPPVEDTAGILKEQLLYITLFLLAAAVALSFLLSKSFTRPLLDITQAAKAISEGNLAVRIETNRQDEIGRLGETINRLGRDLAKVEQLRKDLIANISHELRTPLSLIKGYAETIKDVSGDSPEKREQHLKIITAEADRLDRMVQEILDFSQVQAGYVQLKKQRIKINDLLNNVFQKFQVLCSQAQVELSLKCEAEVYLEADEARLEQILFNLLHNALHHSPQGGKISLKLIEKEESVRVEVEDTGEGISKKDLPYLWDRFYKTDKSGVRQTNGAGLGLAIVQSLLLAHGFPYGVQSREGAGSIFWFEFEKSQII